MFIFRLLVTIVTAASLVLPAALPVQAQVYDTAVVRIANPAKSGPVCGAYVNGKMQEDCPVGMGEAAYATYLGPAGTQSCLSANPLDPDNKRRFHDLATSACYECPAGYEFSGEALETKRSCRKPDPSIKAGQFAARFMGSLCPAGSFFDPIRGGECYSCPSGFNRAIATHVNSQQACHRPAAKRYARAILGGNATGFLKTDCSAGRFADLGKCWSCPAGYNRELFTHIESNEACVRIESEAWAAASPKGTAECKPGEIRDFAVQGAQNIDLGGGCWRCPDDTVRTVHPITGAQACERLPGYVYAQPQKTRVVGCSPGDHWDMYAVDNTMLSRLKAAGRAAPGATASNGGATCWACPAGSKRTIKAVYDAGACTGSMMLWYSAPYQEPGLFGLKGADAVALELINERIGIEAAIEAIAAEEKTPVAQVSKEVWDEIRRSPGDSAVLKAVMFTAMTLAIAEPDGATPAMKQLVASFTNYYRDRNVYTAREALAAYDAWKATDDWLSGTRTDQLVLFNLGRAPPDFFEVVSANTFASTASAAAAVTGIAILRHNKAIYNKIAPFAQKAARKKLYMDKVVNALDDLGKNLVDDIGKSVDDVAKGGSKIISKIINSSDDVVSGAAKTAKAAKMFSSAGKMVNSAAKAIGKTIAKISLKSLSKLAVSLGPQIIVAAAVEAAMAAGEHVIEQENARPKLLTALGDAQRTPDLERIMLSDGGLYHLSSFWTMAVSHPSIPPNAQRFLTVGSEPAPKLTLATPKIELQIDLPQPLNQADAKNWEQIPGRAHDIAVATDGTVWVIGDSTVPGGKSIHFRGPKDREWGYSSGGAVRIAVAGTTPWVVNDQGVVFERKGKNWAGVPGVKAVDVGASDKGVWVLAEPADQKGDFTVYRRNGNRWERVDGSRGVRIAVDIAGNAWVANASGQITAYWNGRWLNFGGSARDIAIDAFGAPAAIDSTGKVQLFDRASDKWIATGRSGTAIAMGAGQVWHLGPNTEVFRKK